MARPGNAIFIKKEVATFLQLASACPTVDKRLVLMTDIYTQGLVYGFGMCSFFLILTLSLRELLLILLNSLLWIALAGILDVISLLLQLSLITLWM